jgi:TorA maturation chaperone TorD
MKSFLEARAFAYDILKSAFLQEPSNELIALFIECKIVENFPFAASHESLGEAVQKVAAYLDQPDVLSDDVCDDLHWDYTRLFIGPGKVPAPPWESVYRDRDQLHFTKETLQVREAYAKYNLLTRNLGREPDDHIGLELDFMHKLCGMAAEKAEAGDHAGAVAILEDQKAFLDAHLLQWAGDWAADVARNAQSGFYKGMAHLLAVYLEFDRKVIDALIGEGA